VFLFLSSQERARMPKAILPKFFLPEELGYQKLVVSQRIDNFHKKDLMPRGFYKKLYHVKYLSLVLLP